MVCTACGRFGFDPIEGPPPPDAAPIVHSFADFTTCPTELVLTGSATCTGGRLQLTADANDLEGGAFLATPLAITPTTRIAIHLILEFPDASPSPPGDGLVFVLHGDPRGPTALGGGAGLGYGNITPSVGVEVDTFQDTVDADDNHVGIDRDGETDSVDAFEVPFRMNDNGSFHLLVDYEAGELSASVTVSELRPSTPNVSAMDDLSRLGSEVWLGVVAGTAFAAQGHEILGWRITITP